MNDECLYLTIADRNQLVATLREIPDLAADLAAAIALPGYPRRYSLEPRVRGSGETPVPFPAEAQDAADVLTNELWGWIRLVLEQRRMDYDGATSLEGLARWLQRNIIALSMTEGSGDAPRMIEAAVKLARRACRTPRARTYGGTVREAESFELNAKAIERMRCELGDEYAGLTTRRIRTLRDRGLLTPVRTVPTTDGPLDVFRLGDVLSAHRSHPTRRRTA
ncbi:hypothetical protein DW322_08780 [Rhodococcus rhodnii]|uniref:Uncharacterized protein n=2 Tax=Rhodococcus rhodnii TaxID=38312 RepID=R7WRG7_9NOCA|nr:hypothetical protein [Rhodococcus rhodnii]EOM77918.1 hypothetical protein Rrhod_0727 [Rhodococcus rhodnii LMG 5362]TXG90301.1 hypothetical protein DW322_08780 [Rhodococcus rhodnii]